MAVAVPIKEYGTVAGSLVAVSSGDIADINEDGVATGEVVRSSYFSGGLTFSRILMGNLGVGATLKGAYHYIDAVDETYSADGILLDAGVQYRFFNTRLVYGAALRNLGFMRAGYGSGSEALTMPTVLEIGLSYVPRHVPELRVAFDMNKKAGDYLNFELGAEATFLKNLFLRAGTSMSLTDVENRISSIRGETDEDYQRSNMMSFSLGAGLLSEIDNVDVKADVAAELGSNMTPVLVLSLLAQF